MITFCELWTFDVLGSRYLDISFPKFCLFSPFGLSRSFWFNVRLVLQSQQCDGYLFLFIYQYKGCPKAQIIRLLVALVSNINHKYWTSYGKTLLVMANYHSRQTWPGLLDSEIRIRSKVWKRKVKQRVAKVWIASHVNKLCEKCLDVWAIIHYYVLSPHIN